jgi:hypothetical protein
VIYGDQALPFVGRKGAGIGLHLEAGPAQREKRPVSWKYAPGHEDEPLCHDCMLVVLEGDVGVSWEVCKEGDERKERE